MRMEEHALQNNETTLFNAFNLDMHIGIVVPLYIYVNPQMETNSIRKRGFPIWEYSSLPAHFRTVITIWKR